MGTSSTNVESTPPVRPTRYLLGVLLRSVLVTILLLAGMGLMIYLDFGEQVKSGIPAISIDEIWLALFSAWILLTVPIALVVLMAECQLFLLRSMHVSLTACVVTIPFTLALVGGLMGYFLFVADREPPAGIAARMFILGTALLFFLAGSFLLWFFQVWMNTELRDTPIGWYAVALVLAGGFLGSMVAWQAPSPYIRSVLDYYHDEWSDRPSLPPLPITPSRDESL